MVKTKSTKAAVSRLGKSDKVCYTFFKMHYFNGRAWL